MSNIQVTNIKTLSGIHTVAVTESTGYLQITKGARTTGVITASTFSGDLNSSGISTITTLNNTNINSSGVITATTFVGNVQGSLSDGTYNLNTSGIITASNFVGNLTGIASQALDITDGDYSLNTTGIITAFAFYGDGSTLDNIGGIGPTEDISTSGIITASAFYGSNGFISDVGISTAVQITWSGTTLTFSVAGIGSTSFTLS